MIRVGAHALCKRVARIPVGGEVGVAVGEVAGVDVLRKTRLLVHTDGVALLPRRFLFVEIHGVRRAEDIETMTMVSSDDDLRVFELADFLQMRDGGLDGVVEFEEFTESTVVVESMHLFVDVGCFRHQEPASIVVGGCAGLENINGFESHFFEAGLVGGIAAGAVWGIFVALNVVGVDVTVKPAATLALTRIESNGRCGCTIWPCWRWRRCLGSSQSYRQPQVE